MVTRLLSYTLVSWLAGRKKGDKAAGEMDWRGLATRHKGFSPQRHFFFKVSFFFYPFTCLPPASRH